MRVVEAGGARCSPATHYNAPPPPIAALDVVRNPLFLNPAFTLHHEHPTLYTMKQPAHYTMSNLHFSLATLNPKAQTPHPKPETPNPAPYPVQPRP